MEITFLVFSIDAFPFFKNLWMTETKHDKHNFKRGLRMWKMRKSTEKIKFFVGEQWNYLQIFLNASKAIKFKKLLNFGEVDFTIYTLERCCNDMIYCDV